MTKKLGIAGVVAGGVLGLALTFGNPSTSQQVEMWRKVGQTIYPVPSTLTVNLGAVNASATTTLSDGLSLRNSTGLCLDFYATSTATIVKMVASSTAALTGQTTENAGVMLLQYGACSI